MRSAIAEACTVLEVTSFVEDLDREVCAGGEGALGAGEGAASRIWFHRFCLLRDSLAPVVVLPIRGNFLSLIGRRVRLFNFPCSQRRTVFLWARDFRSAVKVFRNSDPTSPAQTREGDTADSASPRKRPRRASRALVRIFATEVIRSRRKRCG